MALLLPALLISGVSGATGRPNFIFILTDDQDVTLDSLQALPSTLKYLANEGISFNNTFIATPICCPSRTETIAGRHFQNLIDLPGSKCMHVAAQHTVFNDTTSLFQIFSDNGWRTASFGKLTNDMAAFWCNDNPATAGFDRVHCPCDFNDFYGQRYFDKFSNGSTRLYSENVTQALYETSFVGNASLAWLSDRLADTAPDKAPFLMWIGPHAPHYPATPAAWYADRFANATAPRTPNFNASDSAKHGFVGTNPSISATAATWIDQLYRDRLRSLLSVDDLVAQLMQLLEQYPAQLANTYVLLTSDHGYHLGQYDVPCSKQQPYEETMRIPMFLRGPSLPKNVVRSDVVGNIDILPTFLSLAGIEYDAEQYDGRSWTDGVLQGSVSAAESEFRSVYLSNYWSVGTYGFSHCETWFPAADGSVCPGTNKAPPETNAEGQAWLVDDADTNNWRALRVMNSSLNALYAEFYAGWGDAQFAKPYFFEFYDLDADPFQLHNAYASLSKAAQGALHDMLVAYGNCTGSACW